MSGGIVTVPDDWDQDTIVALADAFTGDESPPIIMRASEAARVEWTNLGGNEIMAALFLALEGVTVIEARQSATIETRGGGNFTYEYADLADVLEVVEPRLAEHGLRALTPVHANGNGGLAVTVTLLHRSGRIYEFPPLSFAGNSDPRSAGSSMTYFRRYAIVAAFGLAVRDRESAGGDDDGAAGQAGAKRAAEPTTGPDVSWLAREYGPKHAAAVSLLGVALNAMDGAQRAAFRREFGDLLRLPPDDLERAEGWVHDESEPEPSGG